MRWRWTPRGTRRIGAALRGRRHRRLRPRRAGAVQRHRPAVPHRRRSPPAGAAGGRVHAVFPVGSRPEGRPRHALGRATAWPRRDGDATDPHLAARRPPARRRRGAVRRLHHALPRRLPARRGRPPIIAAKRAERDRAPPPLRRQPVRGRAEHQGRPRRPARPADALLDGALRVRHRQRCSDLAHGRGPGRAASSRRPRRGWRSAPGTSSGRCASTCTTSPAAPRSG